jgi:hypothetical protein
MVRAPVLALPNTTDPFILDTDASDKSVGAELIQIQEGEEKAVAYGSLTSSFLFLGLGQSSKSLIYPGPMCIPLGPTTLPRNSTSY